MVLVGSVLLLICCSCSACQCSHLGSRRVIDTLASCCGSAALLLQLLRLMGVNNVLCTCRPGGAGAQLPGGLDELPITQPAVPPDRGEHWLADRCAS